MFKIYKKIAKNLYGSGITKIPYVNKLNKKLVEKIKPEFAYFHEYKMYLDKYDMNQLLVLENKKDFHEINFIRKKIEKGNNVIDVGANIGCYTVVLAGYVGMSGSVFAFEPAPDNFEILSKNIQENNLTNVKCFCEAVSDYTGKGLLDISTDCAGYFLTKTKSNAITIDVCNLDSRFKDQRIDFIKIDAEGQEVRVLKGMTEILKQSNQKMLIEWEQEMIRRTGDNPKEMLEILDANGFKLYNIQRNRGGGEVVPISTQELLEIRESDPLSHRNIFCEKSG